MHNKQKQLGQIDVSLDVARLSTHVEYERVWWPTMGVSVTKADVDPGHQPC